MIKISLLICCLLCKLIVASSGTLSIGPVNGLAHTGVGGYKAIDTMVLNPSWIGDFDTLDINHGLTIGVVTYVPSYKSTLNLVNSSIEVENKLGTIHLPYLGYVSRLSPQLTYAFGVFSGGGAGSDYSDSPTSFDPFYVNINSFYGSTSFVNSLAYAYDKFRFGISLDISSGILSSSFDDADNKVGSSSTPVRLDTFSSTSSTKYLIGIGYKFYDCFQFGLNYTSKMIMDYEDGNVSYSDDTYVYSTKTIEEPARISLGSIYSKQKFTLLSDIHYFFWENTNQVANGWVNNTMYNVGVSYSVIADKLSAALGLSYSTRVIGSSSADSVNTVLMNTAFQPAIQEIEWSFSADYVINTRFSAILNAVYWPETNFTQSFGSVVGSLKTSGYGYSLRIKMDK